MFDRPYLMRMTNAPNDNPPKKPLTPAAKRALAEAAERRKQREASETPRPSEKAGPKGAEERGGIAYDF